MNPFTYFITLYPFITYLIVDVASILASRLYVKGRLRYFPYKTYNVIWLKMLFILFIISIQALAAVYEKSVSTDLLITFLISFFYLLFALVDFRIRIVGNDMLLIFIAFIFIIRIFNSNAHDHLYYVCFSIIIFCILICITFLLGKIFGQSNELGMGDIKLLTITAYLLGVNQFISMLLLMLIVLAIYMLFKLLISRLHVKQMIPLAPFVSISTIGVCLLHL